MYIYRVQYRERKKNCSSLLRVVKLKREKAFRMRSFAEEMMEREGSTSVEIYRILDPDKFKKK